MSVKENDLAIIINQQEEQLARYKQRLQDLIIAYKKLTAEKGRLEEMLKTLTSVNPLENDSNRRSEENLKEKIVEMAQSLSSMSTEKSQLETQFQAERKQLLEKNVELEENIKHLTISLMSTKKSLDSDIQNKKSLISLENHSRELELSNSIRELQKILNDERKKRAAKELLIENLKLQLEEMQGKLWEYSNQGSKESENDRTSHILMESVHRDLKNMKEQHDNAVQLEQTRTLKAEEAARRLAVEHEHRVSKLEEKLSQFSDLASKYNKHRQEDQDMIVKLKNRLMLLELENSNVKCEDDRVTLNEETLIQQLHQIKQQLIVHYSSSNQLQRVKEIFHEALESICSIDGKNNKDLYNQFEQDVETIQEIPKQSKLRSTDEIEIPKQKLHRLKSRISDLEARNSRLENDLLVERGNTEKILNDEHCKWESKLHVVEKDYRNKLMTLESELEKQRGRMSCILEERENQIHQIQQKYFISTLSEGTTIGIKNTSKNAARQQSSNLIYYLEDAARKDQEIGQLRRTNSELQIKMHELEQDHLHHVQLYGHLRDEIQNMEKQRAGSEELSSCYLKNVFLNYLLTNESSKRSHMLNAIFAVLKFSDLEVSRVTKHQKLNT